MFATLHLNKDYLNVVLQTDGPQWRCWVIVLQQTQTSGSSCRARWREGDDVGSLQPQHLDFPRVKCFRAMCTNDDAKRSV